MKKTILVSILIYGLGFSTAYIIFKEKPIFSKTQNAHSKDKENTNIVKKENAALSHEDPFLHLKGLKGDMETFRMLISEVINELLITGDIENKKDKNNCVEQY